MKFVFLIYEKIAWKREVLKCFSLLLLVVGTFHLEAFDFVLLFSCFPFSLYLFCPGVQKISVGELINQYFHIFYPALFN